MTTQKKISNLIERYLSNDLEEIERDALLKMIEENKAIKDEFILREKINKAVQKKDVMELRRELKVLSQDSSRNHSIEEPKSLYKINLYQVAALIILLIGVGLILNRKLDKRELSGKINDSVSQHVKLEDSGSSLDSSYTNYSSSDTSSSVEYNESDDQSKEIDQPHQSQDEEILIAINERKSEYFESFIVNYRADGKVTMLPKPSAEFAIGAEILFKWNVMPGDSILLNIYNNKEELMHSFWAQDQFYFKQKLSPGLYYWKLETEDDLLYLNKFFIR